MNIKVKISALTSILIILMLLTSCVVRKPVPSASAPANEYSASPSATADPPTTPSPSASTANPIIQTTPTPIPTPTPISAPQTVEDAAAICNAWLDNHPDLTSYAVSYWEEPDSPLPPTYQLYGEEYYELFVSPQEDESSGYSHEVLVHAKTGDLLSLFRTYWDGEIPTHTVERLDDWYNGGLYPGASSVLTPDEAIAIYNTWLEEHLDASDEPSEYVLDALSYEKYVIFGEEYYYFRAAEPYKYWYNILVHMETGDLLFMMISDGMYSLTSIEPLGDWWSANSQY